jgi:hypothetical protein
MTRDSANLIGPIVHSMFFAALTCLAGCKSTDYADRGALFGGLGGAGLGALIGSASGHAGAGAAIGAVAGALTGGAVGGALDDVDARNRAQIAAETVRASPTAIDVNDVVAMVRGGVSDQLIVNQLSADGLARPLQANDIVYLQQNGVSPGIIDAMQHTRVAVVTPPPRAILMPANPPSVIVADPYYYGPYYGRPYWY